LRVLRKESPHRDIVGIRGLRENFLVSGAEFTVYVALLETGSALVMLLYTLADGIPQFHALIPVEDCDA